MLPDYCAVRRASERLQSGTPRVPRIIFFYRLLLRSSLWGQTVTITYIADQVLI
jgi:hypothetical protein